MLSDYQVIQIDKPDDAAWKMIGGGLHDFNVRQVGPEQNERICFILYSPGQEIVGGLIGEIHWRWFYINILFIKEELCCKGCGHQLLTQAEDEARKRGAKHVYLDTFSFQAPEFYLQHDYRVFGELKDFPPGHQRLFFTKEL